MTRTLKNQKLPLLEKEEATLLLETICFQVNAIPYAADHERLFLSPNDILVPNFSLNSLATTYSPLLINKHRLYHSEIQHVLERAFLSD